MDKPIIEVKNLGKKYLIGERQPYLALRDSLAELIKKPLSLFHKHEALHPGQNEFWALKDLNFSVKHGDVVGIIGRNGAGKSTLLKILSQITPPTTGNIHLRGRIASLLEVGTGFHPELTGRENIYLNGALLGMKKWEIKEKFDQIVEFADVSKFLDTPVKRYSSGMYVRLAFSVAAHLEPDILVIDEVLAVGDTEFQKKCLGKMEEVTHKEGRTILFVSHNMDAVRQLCKKSILLEHGQITAYDDTDKVIKKYIGNIYDGNQKATWKLKDDHFVNQWFTPKKIELVNNQDESTNVFSNDADIWLKIEGETKTTDPSLHIGYCLYDQNGSLLYWSFNTDTKQSQWPTLKMGINRFKTQIPKRLLNEGSYIIEFASALFYKQWICEPGKNSPALSFTIKGGLSDSPYWTIKRTGILAPELQWFND